MTAARAYRSAPRPSRSERMAKLLTHYDFASLVSPARVVPDEEVAFVRIGAPAQYRAADRFVSGILVSYVDTLRMQMRAAAARVWLARQLASMAKHEGLAAAWRGTAREALCDLAMSRRALRRELAR